MRKRNLLSILAMLLALQFCWLPCGSCASTSQPQGTIAMSVEDFNELRMTLNQSKEALILARTQLTESNKALANAKMELGQSSSEITMLKEQLAVQREAIATLQTQLTEASNSLTAAKKSLADTRNSVAELEKAHIDKENSLRRQRDGWKWGAVATAIFFGFAF